MPEITCKYNYNVPHSGSTTFGKEILEFPMPESKIDRLLEKCEVAVPNGSHYLYALKWRYDQYIFEGSEMDSFGIGEIYNLNSFAERLSGLNSTDRLKLYGLYEHDSDRLHLTGVGGPYHPDLIKCVNMTYNLDGIKVNTEIATAAELGKSLVDNKQISGFDGLPDTVKNYLDYTKIGEEFCKDNNGIFVNNSFVYNIPLAEQLQTPYQGKTIEQAATEENTMDTQTM